MDRAEVTLGVGHFVVMDVGWLGGLSLWLLGMMEGGRCKVGSLRCVVAWRRRGVVGVDFGSG